MAVDQKIGTIVAIASQKGGVGKTTTAVNLAATISLAGKKVLLIDLDPQGNASSGVGFFRAVADDGAEGNHQLLSSILSEKEAPAPPSKTTFQNLSILPSNTELSDAEMIAEFRENALPRLRTHLEGLRKEFEFILIDCPPALGGLSTISLSVSDSVLIPIQCEYYAMEGLSQILPVIKELQTTDNSRLEILGLLLTMFSPDLQLSHDIVDEVRGHFAKSVFRTVIPRDVVLAEAASHGVPAYYYDATSCGSWSYIELAKEVLE